jgi:hypothetical protein
VLVVLLQVLLLEFNVEPDGQEYVSVAGIGIGTDAGMATNEALIV